MLKTREEARALMEEWVSSESLRRHCLSVAESMEAFAKMYLEEGKIKVKSELGKESRLVGGVCEDGEGDEGERIEGQADGGDVSGVNNDEGGGGGNDQQAILDKWWICGLLHDFDWERYPTLEEHPIEGCKKLRENGYDEDIIEAILGHNKATGIKRRSLMAKTLFAVDELSGLIVALARVRPGDFEGMSAKSVKKAMKKKDFAAAINRDDIRLGIEELGIGEEEKDGFFELVVKALDGKKRDLGF